MSLQAKFSDFAIFKEIFLLSPLANITLKIAKSENFAWSDISEFLSYWVDSKCKMMLKPHTFWISKFWTRRNFWRQQNFESGYADFHWNLEQIRGFWTFWGRNFWGVAGRNFCQKIRIELKFHWKKKLSHLDPQLMFLCKIRYPPLICHFWTALLYFAKFIHFFNVNMHVNKIG